MAGAGTGTEGEVGTGRPRSSRRSVIDAGWPWLAGIAVASGIGLGVVLLRRRRPATSSG